MWALPLKEPSRAASNAANIQANNPALQAPLGHSNPGLRLQAVSTCKRALKYRGAAASQCLWTKDIFQAEITACCRTPLTLILEAHTAKARGLKLKDQIIKGALDLAVPRVLWILRCPARVLRGHSAHGQIQTTAVLAPAALGATGNKPLHTLTIQIKVVMCLVTTTALCFP